jgi:hypothetical protein
VEIHLVRDGPLVRGDPERPRRPTNKQPLAAWKSATGVDAQVMVRDHKFDVTRQWKKTTALFLAPVEHAASKCAGLLLPAANSGKRDTAAE